MEHSHTELAGVPKGGEFLALVLQLSEECASQTDVRLPALSQLAPACVENLGTALSLLHQLASCWWGCKREDHCVEYLLGRCASMTAASVLLLRHGYYDESLALSRSIGETGNLLMLFAIESGRLERWQSCDRRARLSEFSPAKVREALEQWLGDAPIATDRYRALSEIATHVTPDTKPQVHNRSGLAVLGGHFQQAGVILALNELAIPICFILGAAGKLLSLVQSDIGREIYRASKDLLNSIGTVQITELDRLWKAKGDEAQDAEEKGR